MSAIKSAIYFKEQSAWDKVSKSYFGSDIAEQTAVYDKNTQGTSLHLPKYDIWQVKQGWKPYTCLYPQNYKATR